MHKELHLRVSQRRLCQDTLPFGGLGRPHETTPLPESPESRPRGGATCLPGGTRWATDIFHGLSAVGAPRSVQHKLLFQCNAMDSDTFILNYVLSTIKPYITNNSS